MPPGTTRSARAKRASLFGKVFGAFTPGALAQNPRLT
jgi:hypothetical protein